MEVEKPSLKGGFLHLFDWNIKSRKKLFSSKSEVHESSKQRKGNTTEQAHSEFQKVHDYRFGLDTKQNYDYHSTSSVSGDEVYGQRPPGVVARLMGLDSLPTSQVSELYQASPPYSHSYRDSHYPRATDNFEKEHRIVVYEDIRNKLDGFSMNPVEMRLQKLQNLPIERFQTEILPPKSAKPISVTQHRMLSPIKSPGFILPKNAEYIMEAASRIIQQSPRSSIKNKIPQGGSSSVPLRMRDLREKMDAAQKPLKVGEVSQRVRYHNSVKHMRRQPTERVQSPPEDTRPLWVSEALKRDASRSKGKEKSVSLAVQAKTNIQKREGSAPSGNRTNVTSTEYNEGKSGRKRPNAQKSLEKRTVSSKPSNALRQNNQKQNGSSNKDGETPKHSVSHPKERKYSSSNDSSRSTKTVKSIIVNNRNSSGAPRFMATDMGKEPSSSRSKTLSRKEQPVSEDIHSDGTVANNIFKSKDEKSVKCNVTIEGCTDWDRVEKKNGTDVISFTFTSPIKKTMPDSTLFTRITENKILSLISDSCDIQSLPKSSIARPLGLDVIGGDALGILLDEKLKELTSIVGSSGQDLNEMGSISSSANTFQNSAPIHDTQSSISAEHSRSKFNPTTEKTDVQCDFASSPIVAPQPKTEKWQQSEDIEDDFNGIYIGHDRQFNSQYPSPASSLDPSFSADSCTLSDSNDSFNGDGTKNHFAGSHGVRGRNSSITLAGEDDAELLDSASSVAIGNRNRESTIAFLCADIKGSTYWELEYIRDIIRNTDFTKNESFSTEAHRIISVDLFDQLELQKIGQVKNIEESKPRRRVLFDCVAECLESKHKESFCGSFQSWARWNMLVERKEWLAEELYREMSCWTNMEDLNVDELVDKDMSTRHGKWTEFGMEELEEGVEIEKGILTSLVEELVCDIMLC